MAILEVDAKMLEQMTSKAKNTQKSKPTKTVAKPKATGKRKKPEVVTPPESGSDSTPEGEVCEPADSPKKKVKAPKSDKEKKPLTEKQQAALEKRRAAAAAMTEEEKAERKRLMLEKRAATKAAKQSGESPEEKPKKVEKPKEEKPPKWLKDYVSTAKELEEDPETVEERAAESWKTQKKKLVNKYMRNNASLYSMIFRR